MWWNHFFDYFNLDLALDDWRSALILSRFRLFAPGAHLWTKAVFAAAWEEQRGLSLCPNQEHITDIVAKAFVEVSVLFSGIRGSWPNSRRWSCRWAKCTPKFIFEGTLISYSKVVFEVHPKITDQNNWSATSSYSQPFLQLGQLLISHRLLFVRRQRPFDRENRQNATWWHDWPWRRSTATWKINLRCTVHKLCTNGFTYRHHKLCSYSQCHQHILLRHQFLITWNGKSRAFSRPFYELNSATASNSTIGVVHLPLDAKMDEIGYYMLQSIKDRTLFQYLGVSQIIPD